MPRAADEDEGGGRPYPVSAFRGRTRKNELWLLAPPWLACAASAEDDEEGEDGAEEEEEGEEEEEEDGDEELEELDEIEEIEELEEIEDAEELEATSLDEDAAPSGSVLCTTAQLLGSPPHAKPASTRHSTHPSPITALPSSHDSAASSFPFPHAGAFCSAASRSAAAVWISRSVRSVAASAAITATVSPASPSWCSRWNETLRSEAGMWMFMESVHYNKIACLDLQSLHYIRCHFRYSCQPYLLLRPEP